MCTILFSYKQTPGYRLIMGANRDEFLERPTEPLDYFNDEKTILAGRDLRGGGTWFGLHANGKVAGITNYRDPALNDRNALSRGKIIQDYLEGGTTPWEFLQILAKDASRYNGFNVILGDWSSLFFYSNAAGKVECLAPGIYGLSNHLLDTPWPKVKRGKKKLEQALGQPTEEIQAAVFSLLQDKLTPPDSSLPKTGVGLEWERILSSIFITSPSYGTRSSTFLSISEGKEVTLVEKSFEHAQYAVFESGEKRFHFFLDI